MSLDDLMKHPGRQELERRLRRFPKAVLVRFIVRRSFFWTPAEDGLLRSLAHEHEVAKIRTRMDEAEQEMRAHEGKNDLSSLAGYTKASEKWTRLMDRWNRATKRWLEDDR